MKKNKVLRTAALVLLCCMFSLCTITGTLAKWVEDFDGTGSAIRAGIFCVGVSTDGGRTYQVMGNPLASPLTFNLGQTLYEAPADTDDPTNPNAWILDNYDYSDPDNPVLGMIHVLPYRNLIAPGTGGYFSITLTNFSEVDVDIQLTAEQTPTDQRAVTADDIPIEWWNGKAWQSGFPGILDEMCTTLRAYPSILAGPKTTTCLFAWRWIFNGDDTLDTALGVEAATNGLTYSTPSVTIRATQID